MGTIRFILAISVITTHSSAIFGLNLLGGGLAVRAFFIISGFYMSLILNEKYVKQPHAYRLFITNRFLRLFPVYWIILALSFLFYAVIRHSPNPGQMEAPCLLLSADYLHGMDLSGLLFLIGSNVFIFLQELVLLFGLDPATGHWFFTTDFHKFSPKLFQFMLVPQAWSISVELQFYLLAPFMVRKNVRAVGGFILMCLLLRLGLNRLGLPPDPWTSRLFPTELLFFLFGNVAYVIYKRIQTWPFKPAHLNLFWAMTLLASAFYSNVEFPFKKIIYLMGFSLALPFIFLRTQNIKWDAYIGELSYPLYLTHMLVISGLHWLNFPATPWLGLTVTTISVLFSVALNELIAKPIEKFRRNRVLNSLPRKAAP